MGHHHSPTEQHLKLLRKGCCCISRHCCGAGGICLTIARQRWGSVFLSGRTFAGLPQSADDLWNLDDRRKRNWASKQCRVTPSYTSQKFTIEMPYSQSATHYKAEMPKLGPMEQSWPMMTTGLDRKKVKRLGKNKPLKFILTFFKFYFLIEM